MFRTRLAAALLGLMLLASSFVPSLTFGQTQPHILSRVIIENDRVRAGDKFWIGIEMVPTSGWHTYWKYPGDSGMRTTIKWQLPPGVTLIDTQWPAPDRIWSGPIANFGYDTPFVILTQFKTSKTLQVGDSLPLSVKIDWLSCADICIPESTTLSTHVTIADATSPSPTPSRIALATQKIPIPTAYPLRFKTKNDTQVELSVTQIDSDQLASAYFFPDSDVGIRASVPQKFKPHHNGFTLTMPVSKPIPHDPTGVLLISFKDGTQKFMDVTPANFSHKTPMDEAMGTLGRGLLLVLFALLGGAILNVMPCVFPILSLKMLSLLNTEKRSQAFTRRNATMYTLGVLVSMWALFLTVTLLKAGGSHLGWGFQLQSPTFVTILVYLMIGVGFYLLDFIPIPAFLNGIMTKAGSVRPETSFLTGVLAVFIATPCTAPFMAAAIGAALSGPVWAGFLLFTALGIGFALPFAILGNSPNLAKRMPKPGRWMERVKELLAFPMILSGVWLISVLVNQVGAGAITWVLSGIVAIGFSAWLTRVIPKRAGWVYGIMAALLVVSLFQIHHTPPPASEKASTPDDIAAIVAKGKPVFVNVTAEWCITCQVNEKLVLDTDATRALFSTHNITFVKLDWTNRNSEITQYLDLFQKSGVPLYVYYPSSGKPIVLPQILTPSNLKNIISRPTSNIN